MSDIFLSYATGDRPRTRLLVEALESQGWSVWWDRTIAPGRTFDSVIEKSLAEARCVVVLWSKASVSSDWVKTEAAEAARRGVLVPVLIDEVTVPLEFRRVQAARLVGWTGDQTQEEFSKLLSAIADLMGQPERSRGTGPLPAPASQPSRWKRPALLGGAGAVVAAALWVALHIFFTPHGPVVIGVMDIRARGKAPAWMSEFTRDGLTTVLSKYVRTYATEKIDLLREKRGLSDIEAAEQLGITKMVSGTISTADQNVLLEVHVVDIMSGMLEAAEHMRGTEAQLVEMQNQAAIAVLKMLKIELSEPELKRLVNGRTNDDQEYLKLLTETMGGVNDKPSAPAPKPVGPNASWRLVWPATAYADDGGEQGAIQQLLERYRASLESKNVDQIAAIYVEMSPSMRDALTRYFATADELKISFSNYDILVEGTEAVATFTRNDEFKDARSGRDVHLEVRMSSVVTKQDSGWKIRGLRKPS